MRPVLKADLAAGLRLIERRMLTGWTASELVKLEANHVLTRRTTAAPPSFAIDEKQLEKVVTARLRRLKHFGTDTTGRRGLWLAVARGVWQEGKTSFAVAGELGISAALVRQTALRLRKTAADIESGRRLPRRVLSPRQQVRRAIWA